MKRHLVTAIGAALLLLPMTGVSAREVVVSPKWVLLDWLKEVGGDKHNLTEYIEPVAEGGEGDTVTHRLHVPQTVFLRLWKSLNHARP